MSPSIKTSTLLVIRMYILSSRVAERAMRNLIARVKSVLAGAANVIRSWWLRRSTRDLSKTLALEWQREAGRKLRVVCVARRRPRARTAARLTPRAQICVHDSARVAELRVARRDC